MAIKHEAENEAGVTVGYWAISRTEINHFVDGGQAVWFMHGFVSADTRKAGKQACASRHFVATAGDLGKSIHDVTSADLYKHAMAVIVAEGGKAEAA